MTKRFASGSKAWGLCQRCGQRFKLHALQSDGRQRNLLVCTSCWDPKEPLDVPPRINDPTALRRPSPENSVGQVAVISWPSLDLDANTTFFGSGVWASPVATTLTKVSGDNQTGDEGVPLTAMVVRVNDQYGAPIAGATVAFAGGSVDPTSAVTGGDGLASTVLTPVVGSNTVTATVTGLAPVSFTATGNAVINEFITTWKTDNTGTSNNNQITLPLVNGGTYNFLVQWGDGSEDTITTWNAAAKTHTYLAGVGTYTVTISGSLNRWKFANGGDRRKVLTVEQWGTDCVYDQYDGAWSGCNNVVFNATDIPDVSAVTSFAFAWFNCQSLTSFPALMNFAAGNDFSSAWYLCTGLTSFPVVTFKTTGTINFASAWRACLSLTEFPELDTSAGNDFQTAWHQCTGLTSFPLIDTGLGQNFSNAWNGCTGLTEFPLLDTSSGTNFSGAWESCSGLTGAFPLIDTGLGQNFSRAWYSCSGLTSFPLINTAAGTDFQETWQFCTNLATLPALNVGAGTTFQNAFQSTGAITSAPLQGTNATINFANNLLDAAALNAIYTGLADRTSLPFRTITVTGNPGTSGDDPSIATAKNWFVTGS